MPILPPEPDIFPPTLLDPIEESNADPSKWWAVYTLSRREKELMRRLRAMRICHFGPMVEHRNRSPQGRVRTSLVPLFAGYVFLCGSEADRHQAMTTNCISRCLAVDDCSQLVYDLRQIRRLILSGKPLTPESQLEAGMRVRIRSGAMAGMEGMVLKRRGGDRLLVAVQFLQQGASVQLEDFEVERID
jgi:transcriptional antiterminator RfaH